jgi:uncharacterized membrane protein YcaP (DUF421 family)
MEKLVHVEWAELFVPTHSLGEMFVRGTIMYVALFLIFRFLMKRQAGSIGIADVLVVVVIADAAQNAFAKEYQSVTEGLVLVGTIVFWDFMIDWISYRVPALGKILQPNPLPLIKDGALMRRNMRQELMTIDELQSQLRKQGISNVSEVEAAYMESDGEISVIPREAPEAGKKRPPRKKPGAK